MRCEKMRCSSPTWRYRPGFRTWRSASFEASRTNPTNTTASNQSRRTRDLLERDGGAGGRGGRGGRLEFPVRGRAGVVRRGAVRDRGVTVAVIGRLCPLSWSTSGGCRRRAGLRSRRARGARGRLLRRTRAGTRLRRGRLRRSGRRWGGAFGGGATYCALASSCGVGSQEGHGVRRDHAQSIAGDLCDVLRRLQVGQLQLRAVDRARICCATCAVHVVEVRPAHGSAPSGTRRARTTRGRAGHRQSCRPVPVGCVRGSGSTTRSSGRFGFAGARALALGCPGRALRGIIMPPPTSRPPANARFRHED